MKLHKIAATALSILGPLCATSSAQQQKVFTWQPANDESVRLDPAYYHTGRTYHPGSNGGNIHVDIKSQKPVTIFYRYRRLDSGTAAARHHSQPAADLQTGTRHGNNLRLRIATNRRDPRNSR
jgi:hypothetical protein